MSLLTLVQAACDRIGVVRPSVVIASTDQQVLRLLGYAQEGGKAIAQRFDWKRLTSEKTFTSTAAAAQTGALASDFDRIVDGSFFNRTARRPVYGPISPEEWQGKQATVTSVIPEYYRIRGTDLLITPTPADTSTTYAYEYITTNWCTSSGGTGQSAWAADGDLVKLDQELHVRDLVWRFKQGQGLTYDEEFRNFELYLAQMASREGGKPRLNAGGRTWRGPYAPVVPEGNWSP